MLIDLFGSPADFSPEQFAKAAVAAGLDAVLVADRERTDRLDDYLDALEDLGVAAYAGVELVLDKGSLIFVPRDPDDDFFETQWPHNATLQSALERLAGMDGLIIANHPYCRDLGNVFGDRIYNVKNLSALIVRVGRGKAQWDAMADSAAERLNAVRIAGSGDPKMLGRAVTVLDGDIEMQPELCEAIERKNAWPLEMEPLDQPRDRSVPRIAPAEHREQRDEHHGARRESGREDRPRRDGDHRGPRREAHGPREGGERRESRGGDRHSSRSRRDDGSREGGERRESRGPRRDGKAPRRH